MKIHPHFKYSDYFNKINGALVNMARGRKPIASAIKERTGAFKKDPQRRNKQEPKPKSGRPEKPEGMSVLEQACWERTCAELERLNVLTVADRDVVYMYAVNEAAMISAYDRGNPIQSTTWHKCFDRQIKLMGELGLSTSARSRLKANVNEEDPLMEFLRKANEN